jgi:hypothetical protein
MPLFQYIGMPEANFSFDANPDETVYEPVDVTPPVSSKKATSATSEESK